MTIQEHFLTILSEECGELALCALQLAQRASKALRFSLEEIQPGQESTNAERIVAEYLELVAMIEMLVDIGAIRLPIDKDEIIGRKKLKVEKYLEFSEKMGTVTDG